MPFTAVAIACGSTFFLFAAATHAAESHKHASPYRGEESRQIKSLSAADIEELLRGGGWGFAKSAELNGIPGPAHLLELKDEIPLSPEQVAAVETLFREMNAAARAKGTKLIALERELDRRFREGTITEKALESALKEIGMVRSALRFIHLNTHLKTPAILSPGQIRRYNRLRGYGTAGPCDNVPSGHDAAQWRKHNGCD